MITIETEELFKELEKTQHDFWNIARETANFLNMLVKMSNSKSILEIGTSNGYSAMWFALALKEINGTLDTIEFWDKRRQLALENFKKIGVNDIITAHLGSAMEILPKLCKEKEFDFVFIDANKSEYIKTVEKTSFYDEQIMNIIDEEAAPFFAGQKDAKQVTDVIQSRIQTYVNESR